MLIGAGISYLFGGPQIALGVTLLGLYLVLQGHFPSLQRQKIILCVILVIAFFALRPYVSQDNTIVIRDRFVSPYEYPQVGIGLVGAGSRIDVESQDGLVLTDNGEPILRVRLDGEKKTIATLVLRDTWGDIVSEVDNNFVAVSDKVFQINHTDDFLEIIDRKDDVLIQVLVAGGVVMLEGSVRCRDGSGIEFRNEGPGRGSLMHPLHPGESPKSHLTRMCSYPVPRFLGNCSSKLDDIRSFVTLTKGRGLPFYAPLDVCQSMKPKDAH
jgi:hypothetical protein